MFASRVAPGVLTDRLDAPMYDPIAVQLRQTLIAFGARPLSQLTLLIEAGPFGGNAIADVLYEEAGLPFLRPVNVSSNDFDGGDLARVSEGRLRVAGLKIYDGLNLYFGRVGNPCVAAYEGRASISPNLIVAKLDSDRVDGRYAYAACSGPYGIRQLQATLKVVAQPTTESASVRNLLMPVPDLRAQRYIGSKVRQAEALREWARVRVDAILSDYGEVARKLPVTGRRNATVSALMLRDRLDAEHYPDEVLQAFAGASAQEAVRLAEVTIDIFSGSTLPTEEGEAGVRQATVATLDRVFLNDRYRSVQAPRGVGRPFSTHDLSIAAAAHTASYIGKDVTYIVVDGLAYPSTEVLTVRPDRDRVPASWLWCFLKSPLGYRQVQACVRGISAHAYPDDIREVIVPMPTEELRARFNDHDVVMVRANHASVAARLLVTAARLLVEALIERKVTEAELIVAGKDADADRALLARLAEDGLDGAGAPLFSDLDGLAELIAQSLRPGGES